MIGASAIMADYLCRPLRIFRSPYFVLSLAYIIGAIADLFIPSASGLAMLLMVTIYPVLVRLAPPASPPPPSSPRSPVLTWGRPPVPRTTPPRWPAWTR